MHSQRTFPGTSGAEKGTAFGEITAADNGVAECCKEEA